jgi:hypothetical protein
MTQETASPSTFARVTTGLLRAVLALFAVFLVIGALLLGITVAAGVVVWALLRGRRPGPVNLRWGTASMPRNVARRQTGDVVDIAAREIDITPPR